MELEWYMEAGVESQMVRCNMGPAIQDMQVGCSRGLQEEVAVAYVEGMANQREVAYGKELVAAVVYYRMEEGVHIRPLRVAREAGNRVFGDEARSAAVVSWIFEFDC